eukprot:1146841-Pelagomonas_calceolata.AAC.2
MTLGDAALVLVRAGRQPCSCGLCWKENEVRWCRARMLGGGEGHAGPRGEGLTRPSRTRPPIVFMLKSLNNKVSNAVWGVAITSQSMMEEVVEYPAPSFDPNRKN